MKIDAGNIGKAFSPGIMSRAIRTFDRATTIVVLTCWGGAILIMAFALYTLNLSISAKREALEAVAKEPILPRIMNKVPDTAEIKSMVDNLQRKYPEINFVLGKDSSLLVTANSASNFRLWMTVLSYIDTISPQYRWTINEFCVGSRCDKATPMKALISPEKISFVVPEEKADK